MFLCILSIFLFRKKILIFFSRRRRWRKQNNETTTKGKICAFPSLPFPYSFVDSVLCFVVCVFPFFSLHRRQDLESELREEEFHTVLDGLPVEVPEHDDDGRKEGRTDGRMGQ